MPLRSDVQLPQRHKHHGQEPCLREGDASYLTCVCNGFNPDTGFWSGWQDRASRGSQSASLTLLFSHAQPISRVWKDLSLLILKTSLAQSLSPSLSLFPVPFQPWSRCKRNMIPFPKPEIVSDCAACAQTQSGLVNCGGFSYGNDFLCDDVESSLLSFSGDVSLQTCSRELRQHLVAIVWKDPFHCSCCFWQNITFLPAETEVYTPHVSLMPFILENATGQGVVGWLLGCCY